MKFICEIAFLSSPCKSVNPMFLQYQSHRNNDKLNCCLEIQSKTEARISIFTPNTLTLSSIQIHIWCPFLSWPGKSNNPQFSQYQSYKNKYKFMCCFKCHGKMAAIISISTLISLTRDRHHFLSDITFLPSPSQYVNRHYSQYQSYENN